MSSIVCVRCVARCLQEPRDFREALEEHGHHVNFNAEFTFFRPCANCPLGIGISNMQLEVGVSSLEVRAWQSSLSATLPQMLHRPAEVTSIPASGQKPTAMS